jgi:hypothetical protein
VLDEEETQPPSPSSLESDGEQPGPAPPSSRQDNEDHSSDEDVMTEGGAGPRASVNPPPTKKRKGDCNRHFNSDWELEFFASYCAESGKCLCMRCGTTMKNKQSVLKKHYQDKHADTKEMPKDQRQLFVKKWKADREKQPKNMKKSLGVPKSQREASFRLGLLIAKAHLPYNCSPEIVTWASLSDPKSKVFGTDVVKTFPKSRMTVTRRVVDLADFVRDEHTTNQEIDRLELADG